MSTGYDWEGIRQVSATLLGARHVPERLCSGPCPQRGAIASAGPYLFLPYYSMLAGVCSLDQYIYAVGGYDGSSQLSSVERYDVWSDQWTTITSMSCPRSALSVGVINNCIYAIGKLCSASFS